MPDFAALFGALVGQLPEPLMRHLPDLALAGALAWGAGLRLYLVVFLFGLLARLGWWELPEHLTLLAHPLVLGASGFMAIVELFADKLPWLDTLWDGLNTFVRIPAGAALAGYDDGAAVAVASGGAAGAWGAPQPAANERITAVTGACRFRMGAERSRESPAPPRRGARGTSIASRTRGVGPSLAPDPQGETGSPLHRIEEDRRRPSAGAVRA